MTTTVRETAKAQASHPLGDVVFGQARLRCFSDCRGLAFNSRENGVSGLVEG
jgi:hypothetical protein